MNWTLTKTGAAFVLVSLSAACGGEFRADSTGGVDGSAEAAGGSSTGADGSIDRDRSTDADLSTDADSAGEGDAVRVSSPDGAVSIDSASYLDGGNSSDSVDSTADANRMPTAAVNLRTAANYAILAETGISTVPTSDITGNVAISPAAVTYITGFSLTPDSTNAFSTSMQITGKVYAANHATPTPSVLTVAIGDMERAYDDAAGRTPEANGVGSGDIGKMTLPPGVYGWPSGVIISDDVKLAGSDTDVWIFQVGTALRMSANAKVQLTGGAKPQNVFWQIAGLLELGTSAHIEGVVLAQTSVNMHAGASINGRLLAQTAITLDSTTVIEPGL